MAAQEGLEKVIRMSYVDVITTTLCAGIIFSTDQSFYVQEFKFFKIAQLFFATFSGERKYERLV